MRFSGSKNLKIECGELSSLDFNYRKILDRSSECHHRSVQKCCRLKNSRKMQNYIVSAFLYSSLLCCDNKCTYIILRAVIVSEIQGCLYSLDIPGEIGVVCLWCISSRRERERGFTVPSVHQPFLVIDYLSRSPTCFINLSNRLHHRSS